MPAIKLKGISKTYGNLSALHEVSFELESGAFLFVCGPNGAGKTTLLEIICSLKRPSAGSTQVFGKSLPFEKAADLAKIGAAFSHSFLYPDMTVRENLTFWGRLYGVSDLSLKVDGLMDEFDLAGKRDTLVKNLSSGLEKRASIARALVGNPDLIVMDEPLNALDDRSRRVFSSYMAGMKSKGRTAIFTGHEPEAVGALASHALVLVNGRMDFFGDISRGLERVKDLKT